MDSGQVWCPMCAPTILGQCCWSVRCCMPVKTEEPAMKMKTLFDNSLFDEFMGQALEKFELHLKNEGIKQNPLEQRMRGAREFAVFLLGRGHRKGERTKGRI